jgi:hypothetical protein
VRRLSILLVALSIAAGLPRAGWARAEEEAAAIDPQEVGRLLLSPDEAERARGEAMLLERIERGGPLADFVHRMAAAQALWADEHARRLERLKGLRDRLEALRERWQAEGEARAEAVRPEAPASSLPSAYEPPEAVAAAPAEESALAVRVRARVVEVDSAALATWVAALEDGPRLAARLSDGEPLALEGANARRAFEEMPALVDAHTLFDGRRSLAHPLVEGEAVRWRRGLSPVQGRAWAVEGGELPRGVRVTARLEPGEPEMLVVEATRSEVTLPLSTQEVRPAPGVEPVELDRPEWEVVRVRARAPRSGGEHTFLLPGLFPGRVLVVGLRVLD